MTDIPPSVVFRSDLDPIGSFTDANGIVYMRPDVRPTLTFPTSTSLTSLTPHSSPSAPALNRVQSPVRAPQPLSPPVRSP